jgi:transposase
MKRIEFWQKCNLKSLEVLLSKTNDISVFKNIQAVYLKAKYQMNADSIAKVTGFSKGYIWQIHSNYRNNGDEAFIFGKRGGVYRRNLTAKQEELLLESFASLSDGGQILEVSKIKKKYEEFAKKEVNKSVVYRMLSRNGWRKIAPRPTHPNNDKILLDSFKKTSHKWYKMQG